MDDKLIAVTQIDAPAHDRIRERLALAVDGQDRLQMRIGEAQEGPKFERDHLNRLMGVAMATAHDRPSS
jgi:hypothetical protein